MKKDRQLYMRIVVYRYKTIINNSNILCVVRKIRTYRYKEILVVEVIEDKILENKKILIGCVFWTTREHITPTEFSLLENLP